MRGRPAGSHADWAMRNGRRDANLPQECTTRPSRAAACDPAARHTERTGNERARDRPHGASDPTSPVRWRDGPDARRLDGGLEPGAPRPAAGGRAERAARADRRCRLRQPEHLRRSDLDAELHPARGQRAALQPLPRHRAVLADQGGAAHRAQPPPRRFRHGGRVLRALPGLQRDHPARLRAVPAHPPGERLHDGRVREVASDAGQPAGLLGPLRPLADAAGIRLLLGLPRR